MKTDHTGFRLAARPVLAAAFVLLVPLVSMQFTAEVNWDLFDFAVMGALIIGTGLMYELAAKMTGNTAFRAAVGVALAAAFLLLWVNGAVGIIGSEDNPANLMYGGVLAVGFVGALIARFRPHGMARAMFATALVQALVAGIAVAFRLGAPASGPAELLALNGFFVALWVGSAALFREATLPTPVRGEQ